MADACIVEFGENEIYDLLLLPKADIVRKLITRLKHDKKMWASYHKPAPDEPAAEPQGDCDSQTTDDDAVSSERQ